MNPYRRLRPKLAALAAALSISIPVSVEAAAGSASAAAPFANAESTLSAASSAASVTYAASAVSFASDASTDSVAAAKTSVQSAFLPFDDISGSFALADIVALHGRGIVSGTGERTFSPERAVTRAEFAALVVRLFGLEPVDAAIPSYPDVPAKAWSYSAVEAASQLGIVRGVSAASFGGGSPVTREQAATILVRALRLDGERASASGANAPDYEDADRIDDWAEASIQTAARAGLMQGDNGRFRPLDTLTRAEAAAVLNRIASRDGWAAQFEAAPATGLQLGWQYGQTTSQFIASIARSTVDTLVPRDYFLESARTVSDSTDPALVRWASAHGKRVWGMVGNRSDAEVTHQLLGSASNRKAVADRLAALVLDDGLDGLNLDFENVLPEDRSGLTAFVTELAAKLHANGRVLSVNVSPDQGDDWTAAFDYSALGKQADYIVLMAYDEHWSTDPVAGSVSSLPWLARGVDKLLAAVPASKTIVALPLYTRKWTVSPAVSSAELSLIEQTDVIRSLVSGTRSWNETIGQYVYSYSRGGSSYRIWTEDSRSLTLKNLAAADRGVAGLAYWYIGAETPDVWPAMRNASKYSAFEFE